jgi:hypothetical protein
VVAPPPPPPPAPVAPAKIELQLIQGSKRENVVFEKKAETDGESQE